MPFARATTGCFGALQIAARDSPCKLWAPDTALLRLASVELKLAARIREREFSSAYLDDKEAFEMAKLRENLTRKASTKRQAVLNEVSSWAAVLVMALFIITFNLQTFGIPSSSMEKTLLVGDHLIVDRITAAPKTSWAFWQHYQEIHRGDIIVFYSPATPGMHLVKRVIAVPGDRIHLRDGVVYLNGTEQKEPYVIHIQHDYEPYRGFPAIPAWQSPVLVTPAWRQRLQSAKQGDDLVVPPDSYFA